MTRPGCHRYLRRTLALNQGVGEVHLLQLFLQLVRPFLFPAFHFPAARRVGGVVFVQAMTSRCDIATTATLQLGD